MYAFNTTTRPYSRICYFHFIAIIIDRYLAKTRRNTTFEETFVLDCPFLIYSRDRQFSSIRGPSSTSPRLCECTHLERRKKKMYIYVYKIYKRSAYLFIKCVMFRQYRTLVATTRNISLNQDVAKFRTADVFAVPRENARNATARAFFWLSSERKTRDFRTSYFYFIISFVFRKNPRNNVSQRRRNFIIILYECLRGSFFSSVLRTALLKNATMTATDRQNNTTDRPSFDDAR